MRQSSNRNYRDKTLAAYLRISREDTGLDESYSISNQKKLLAARAKEMGFTNVIYFIDDGITGTKRDRKEFVRMIGELEKGYIGAVMVKDLSRLGRDHIRMDQYIEEFFPEHDIRLISIAEGLDTDNGEDEFTPFRNLMNEWYARDISKKRKLTNVVKGNAGEPLSPPPYGYLKGPEDSKRWIVDEEAATIVRLIYRMTLQGNGIEQIAAHLDQSRILTPMNYWHSIGCRRGGIKNTENPCGWNHSTIDKILKTQECCGDVINFKTYAKSFKLKKRIPNTVENMAVFHDVHEPIIDRQTWESIQTQRNRARKRRTSEGEKNMFSGLLVCADCGKNLWYHFNQNNPSIRYFNCSNYKGNRGTCNGTHYIRVDFLEKVILAEVRRLTQYVVKHEERFVQAIIGLAQQSHDNERQRKQRELQKMIVRDKELDHLFNRMYEDNVADKIDDDRFYRMTNQYSSEQKQLIEAIHVLRNELQKGINKVSSTESFIEIVRKYTRVRKLTQRMLYELVDRIEVHQSERVDGEVVQKLTIHYNFVGALSIPEDIPLNVPSLLARKGVTVSYAPHQEAG